MILTIKAYFSQTEIKEDYQSGTAPDLVRANYLNHSFLPKSVQASLGILAPHFSSLTLCHSFSLSLSTSVFASLSPLSHLNLQGYQQHLRCPYSITYLLPARPISKWCGIWVLDFSSVYRF